MVSFFKYVREATNVLEVSQYIRVFIIFFVLVQIRCGSDGTAKKKNILRSLVAVNQMIYVIIDLVLLKRKNCPKQSV